MTAFNKGLCRYEIVMYVPTEMHVVYFDIEIMAKHLPGSDNLVADKLSRNDTDQVCRVAMPVNVIAFSIIQISPRDWTGYPHTFTSCLRRLCHW